MTRDFHNIEFFLLHKNIYNYRCNIIPYDFEFALAVYYSTNYCFILATADTIEELQIFSDLHRVKINKVIGF